MKRWKMYQKIHIMKNQGFSKRQIARQLEMDFRTVNKYLAMEPEAFHECSLRNARQQSLGDYESIIVGWLTQYPEMTSAQVHDWLREHYQVIVSDRTVRRFVEKTREKYSIIKTSGNTRQYMAMEDPPMGEQMQVDFGEIWVTDARKRSRTKLHCVAMVLSHSRYKWGKWFALPMKTSQFIQSLEECFVYMGGMAKELVFDQDRLLAVSENYGDIIYTKEFEQYRQDRGFNVYLCRKNDPESKGRVESTVKYFKGNFAKNRQLTSIDHWNESFEEWLCRTANAKEHGTTKKIPAEVFEQERLFLKPVSPSIKILEEIVSRIVHKNNTIFYEGNRYSVPLETYEKERKVSLTIEGDKLKIWNLSRAYVIAEHPLSQNKGEFIMNNNHKRENRTKLDNIQQSLLEMFGSTSEAQWFLAQIRRLKPRYARDQFALIKKTIDVHRTDTIEKALQYCMTNNLYSAVEFRSASEYFAGSTQTEQVVNNFHVIPIISGIHLEVSRANSSAVSKKRNLSAYEQVIKGGRES